MTRRGDWEFHRLTVQDREISAWQYDGQDWWLRRRTGITKAHRWCECAFRIYPKGELPRYYWWQLHTTKPESWMISPPRWSWQPWIMPADYKDYGQCTHRQLLADAMKVAEDRLAQMVLRALGG